MSETMTASEAAAALGRRSAAVLTPEQRRERTRHANRLRWANATPEQRAEQGRKLREGRERARHLREAAAQNRPHCPEHGRDDLDQVGDLCLAEGCDWVAEDGAA
jgi:hypothetical protein